jgi:hypothetical protein
MANAPLRDGPAISLCQCLGASRIRTQGSVFKCARRDFWDSGNPDDGARYEATRQEVWKQLNTLLGLDKK